jgi:hypothetical protein
MQINTVYQSDKVANLQRLCWEAPHDLHVGLVGDEGAGGQHLLHEELLLQGEFQIRHLYNR